LNSLKHPNGASSASLPARFGLIAGTGRFPILFAEAARQHGVEVVAVAHRGQTLPELEHHVVTLHWIKVGQLGKLITLLKEEGITDAALVGGIKKTIMFSDIRPDLHALGLLARVKTMNDDVLLRAVAEEIEKQGITIHRSTLFLGELLSPAGCLTTRRPDKREAKDIDFGWIIAKEIGRLDVGQSIVVKDRTVLAVEAIEGTDEAILRAGRLGRGKGLVVIKVSKPQQDMRFDVPAVGPQTIRTMKEAGASLLALEAGKTLLLEKEVLLREANKAGISIVARE
jgi:UDP-2,3-diacylglucosamine hydrolase